MFCDFPGEHAAGVESTHRELGSWFPDRLGGNNPDRLSHVHHLQVGETPAVAALTNRPRRFASQGRSQIDFGHLGFTNFRRQLLCNRLVSHSFFVPKGHDFPCFGVHHISGKHAPQQPVFEGNQDGSSVGHGPHPNPSLSATVYFAHDYVLGYVHQTPGKIARVGGAQGCIN